MGTLKLFITSFGDSSVGLGDINSKVELEDNLVWDQDMIQQMKEFYAEFYDTKAELVLTEREYLTQQLEELKLRKAFVQVDIDDMLSEEAVNSPLNEKLDRLSFLEEDIKKSLEDKNIL